MDRFEKSPVDPRIHKRISEEREGALLRENALQEVRLLVSVLESERDLLVSGDWERLDSLLEEKNRRSGILENLLADLPPEDFLETEQDDGAPSLRSALLHLEELASVNLAIARESSMMVEHVLREISVESDGGKTYGSRGTVGPGSQSPALVSTRG